MSPAPIRFRRVLLAFAASLAVPLAASAQQLTVSAAASLTDAFKEIGPRFEVAKAGATVRFNFAASGVLLQQVSQGAPVDVFVSADEDTIKRGIEQKLLDPETRRDFASNALVLVIPAQNPPPVARLQDLSIAAVKRIAIGKAATVPVGRYTQQALEQAQLWSALEARFVQADSVRQVLDYVSRGEADAGFVYRTDATLAADKVKVVQTVRGHAPVRYPAAVVGESRNKAAARDFVAFLMTDEAQAILAKHGFGGPND